MRLRLLLAALVLAAAAAPQRAAAQTPAPTPGTPTPAGRCYQCVEVTLNGQTWKECKGGLTTGYYNCSVTNSPDGSIQMCAYSGKCPLQTEASAADQQRSDAQLAALLDGTEALPRGVERTAADGRVELRSRCTGEVLARAYTAAMAAELRRASEALSL